jgi:hypothetical protein
MKLVGREVELKRLHRFAALRQCVCGATRARIGEGKGIHAFSVTCLQCRRVRWLPKGSEAIEYLENKTNSKT